MHKPCLITLDPLASTIRRRQFEGKESKLRGSVDRTHYYVTTMPIQCVGKQSGSSFKQGIPRERVQGDDYYLIIYELNPS